MKPLTPDQAAAEVAREFPAVQFHQIRRRQMMPARFKPKRGEGKKYTRVSVAMRKSRGKIERMYRYQTVAKVDTGQFSFRTVDAPTFSCHLGYEVRQPRASKWAGWLPGQRARWYLGVGYGSDTDPASCNLCLRANDLAALRREFDSLIGLHAPVGTPLREQWTAMLAGAERATPKPWEG